MPNKKVMLLSMIKSIRSTIADNIQLLLDHHFQVTGEKLTQTDLGIKAGVGQRTISNVLNRDSNESITTATIEGLAKAFDLEPYHLLIPNLPVEELLNKRIEKVIECYAQSTLKGRENIERIAENEVRYSEFKQEMNG